MGLTGDVEALNYLSMCAGIEAATVAWHPLGWRAAAYSEIDPFASAVLAHHYPHTPNWGDMTRFKEWPDACRCVSHRHAESVRSPGSSSAGHGGSGRSSIHPDQGASPRGGNSAEGKGSTCEQCGGTAIDVLVGGTPCQSFSVAGLRAGLADPRGNLMLTFLAIAARYRPTWVVWENVPGVLSSNGGRDFGAFLGGLAVCGYGFAYRVLDAQYFGLAQRRRRVFVVANARDWRRAAAVLFDRSSLSGNPAPRREEGEGVAGAVTRRVDRGGVNSEGNDNHLIPAPHAAISPALKARDSKGVSSDGDGDGDGAILVPMVAHSLRASGFDASEDGTGRGTPLVPTAFDTTQITSASNYSNPQPGDPCHPLAAGAHAPVIAFHGSQDPDISGDVIHPVGRNRGLETCVAFQSSQSGVRTGEAHATPDSNNGSRRHNGVLTDMQVRRLTPRECERLQGFPDDYTLIPYRGKPAPDGPRYKALGNSMAVPVMAWIGRRIQMVNDVETLRRVA